jgi:TRAP transporter TAXI family solute receptor
MSSYITKNVEGVKIAAQSSGGAMEHLNLIDADQTDLSFLPSAFCYKAYRGLAPFKEAHTHMMGIGMTNKSTVHMYVLKKSGIKTIADLKGKKVNAGPAGTGMNKVLDDVLAAHGMSTADIKPVYLPYRDAADAMKDGRIDACIDAVGVPGPTILDVASQHEVTILRFAPGAIEKMLEMNPYYIGTTLPGGIYRGTDEELPVVAEGTLWICRPGLAEEIVYKIVKAIYSDESLEYLRKIHTAAKDITLEEGLNGMTLKLHPGAVKFWKEAGLYQAWEEKKLYK